MQNPHVKKTRAQSKRTSSATTTATDSSQDQPNELDPALVCPTGDVVLAVQRSANQSNSVPSQPIQDGSQHSPFLYRVSSKRLQDASPYFARLLDPEKFGEGSKVAEHHAALRTKYPGLDVVPFDELPVVHIADLGRISSNVKNIRLLMADFLRALHGEDLSVKLPPLSNMANLAIVADRFDALAAMRLYFRSRKLMTALDAKGNAPAKGQEKNNTTTTTTTKSLPEERARQKLLAGLLLDNPAWVWHSSLRLVHRGWVGRAVDDDNAALWWDLPTGIEEELLTRRDAILETIQSIQTHFLDAYSSRDRQCKLGYDSSGECDVFQLGQMIKFFRRINTLALHGLLIPTSVAEPADPSPPQIYDADISDLLDSLRQAPEYQIDKNHHHCGLRSRIMPLLDRVAVALTQDVGVCLPCWQENRHEHAWSRAKRPLVWKPRGSSSSVVASTQPSLLSSSSNKPRQVHTHSADKHLDVRDFFMANERLWGG